MTITVHLSKTSNKKLGKGVYASTSSANTCPLTCGMYNKCYAKKGPQSWHWNKVNNQQRGTDWDTFCTQVEQLKPNTLFRHNVSGDLPTINNVLDTVSLDKLQCAVVNSGVRFYTYTHWHSGLANQDVLKRFSQPNFVINLSTEKPLEAFNFKQKGFDVVITNTKVFDLAVETLKTHKQPAKITNNGESVKVIPCPEQYTNSATCANCKLCTRSNRDFVIAFKEH